MSAWTQALLLGFALGALFGFAFAAVIIKSEFRREQRRPGYIITRSNVTNLPRRDVDVDCALYPKEET